MRQRLVERALGPARLEAALELGERQRRGGGAPRPRASASTMRSRTVIGHAASPAPRSAAEVGVERPLGGAVVDRGARGLDALGEAVGAAGRVDRGAAR